MQKVKVKQVREAQKQSVVFLNDPQAYDLLCSSGYTNLAHNPEIITAVNRIAELIASMTIRLMQNTEDGDKRISNGLSRHLDIEPNKNMTRKAWMQNIVRTMLLDGDGNQITYPKTSGGLLTDLIPIPPGAVSFMPDGNDYQVLIGGVPYNPDDLLHFVLNPDPDYPWKGIGYRIALKDVADNLKQAAKTKKGFLSSEWKPSLVIKTEGSADGFGSPEARSKLLEDYIQTNKVGQPWIIPSDSFAVEQVKPLSLTDLAIAENVELDKKTVAAIIGVPAFVLGIGTFSQGEWNNFIDSKIMTIATGIQQELTRKLLIAPDLHFQFNPRSLHAYGIKELTEVGTTLYRNGLAYGNEVRDWVGMNPIKGLNELVILENFIPIEKIGQQKKLNGGDDNG